ncbi:uncharacterized protein LOC110840277 isoform X4 [Zootermopsis nevadensis]|uniref:uncharacterized protein LOC110840277 isoform X4 n=1 Tax=Zootermopsis nevadensis TaxID=136037 RepID=UPI000B8ECC8A|nr:uncharacterized protein LOC110840277 isoform X4 [Zootermopsis nevadensis]
MLPRVTYSLHGQCKHSVVFLKRMTLPMLYRRHLTKTLWNAGFCINAILFCITKLLERANHVADIFFNVDNSFRTEQTSPAHVLFSCVIFAYYIHSICLMYVQKGIDTEFFAKGLLLTFLYTCYSLRYVRTGLSAVVLINVYSLNVEFMRICYCLNQSKATKSGFMRNLTCALFVIHCVLWGGMFLLVLPKFYLLPAINIEVSDENLLLLTVLCATLWAYLWLGISNAPAVKLVRYYAWPGYAYGHCDWLDYVLFVPQSDVIQN